MKLARLQRRLVLVEVSFYALIGWLLITRADIPLVAAILMGVAGMSIGRAGYLWACFSVAGIGRRGRAPGRMLKLFAGEWMAFTLTHTVLQPLRPLLGRYLDRPVPASGAGPLMVFVHGYCCNAAFWLPMRRRLARRGLIHQAGVDLEPVLADIDHLGDQLAERLHALRAAHGERRCIVVAHSMGGLVARAALRRHGPMLADELIAIGTPHGGSLVAKRAPGANARQMRPDSDWLQALNENPASYAIPITALATRDDELVAPWHSALPDFAAHRTELTDVGHLGLGYSRAVADAILQTAGPTRDTGAANA